MGALQIDIKRKNVYEYVTTLTGTLGRQKGEYDKYVCLPDNYKALDRLMDTAIAIVEASVWRKLQNTHNLSLKPSDVDITILIKSDSIPEELHGAIGTNIRLALAYILAGMWLQTIDASLYEGYSKMADSYINTASDIASQRSARDVRYSEAESDSEAIGSGAVPRTGRADINTDSISNKNQNNRTGQSSGNTDDIPVLKPLRTGQPAIKDCCINKHSALDNAIFYPDGTVMILTE